MSAKPRWLWVPTHGLTAPAYQREFAGQVLAVISGPWASFMDTPKDREVRDALRIIGVKGVLPESFFDGRP